MKVVQRGADLAADRQELIAFLHDNLTKDSNSARFDWLYIQGPFGEARAWIATDAESGRTVGCAAAFPRRFDFAGTEHRAWVLGDFCISPEARSLGPAIQLQRTCLASLDGDPWYDFPSPSMTAIYKRLGSFTFEEEVRYAKLLRIDRKVEALVSSKPIGSALRYAGNALLQLRSRSHTAEGLELSLLEGPFNAEFDDLNRRLRGDQIQGTRSTEFLNWRYRQNPLQDFVVIVAKRNTELMGYAVLSLQGGDGKICELTAVEEEATLPALLSYIEQVLSEKDAHTISAPTYGDSRLRPYFRSAGFHPRESHPIVIHNATLPPNNWVLQPADRDS